MLAQAMAWCGMVVVVGACTTVTPARVERAVEARPITHADAGTGTPEALPFSGHFRARLFTRFAGPITACFDTEATDEGLKGNTPAGVAWDHVGGVEGVLGPLLTPFLFPRGMILTWTTTLPAGDAPGEGSIGVGTLPSLRLRTRLAAPGAPVEVLWRNGEPLGAVTLQPVTDAPGTARDYPALARAIGAIVRERRYDRETSAAALEAYAAALSAGAEAARDDLEFMFAAVLAGREHLKGAQPVFYPRYDEAASGRVLARVPRMLDPVRVSVDDATGIATIRVDAFLSAADVDRAFAEACAGSARAIVLDLRGTMGLHASAMRVAAWLVDGPVDAGVLTRKRPSGRPGGATGDRASGAHAGHESASGGPVGSREGEGATGGAPVLETDGDDAIEAWSTFVDAVGRVALTIRPVVGAPDDGTRLVGVPVAVLTSRRTSGTTEALVRVLKATDRARVFGEPTAGRPTWSREFDAGQGWVVRVALAEHELPAATGVAGKSTSPHDRVAKDASPEAAKAWIARELARPR